MDDVRTYAVPDPPAHLHATGQRAWEQLCTENEISDADELALLERACTALDREAQARRRLRDDGLYLTDRFGRLYPHPAVAVEAKSRASAATIIGQIMRQRLAAERLDLQLEREIRMRRHAAEERERTGSRGGRVRRG